LEFLKRESDDQGGERIRRDGLAGKEGKDKDR
jgi:hypothetical protein